MKKAFTLIELLVVISIIGILVTTITLSFANAQKKARDSRRIEDMNSIQKAMEMYYGQNSYKYPATLALLIPNYIQELRKDPKTNESYPTHPSPFDTTSYCVCALMENANEANSSSASCVFSGAPRTHYCVKNRQ